MDVAYPLAVKRPRPDPMIYSLRTLWHHVGVDRVFVAGGKPLMLDYDFGEVYHLPVPEAYDKWKHIGQNLEAVLASDISEDFLWMNDDFFVTQDAPEIPLYSFRTIRDRVDYDKTAEWHRGMKSQYEILKAWGYPDDTPCTDLHVPIVLNKTRLKDLLDRVKAEFPDHPIGHFRMLYGAGLEATPIQDHKIKSQDLPDPSWTFISTNPNSWKGPTGKLIRDRYWRKSPWEVS